MVDDKTALAAICGMAVVTYLSRIGGVWAMAFVPMTPRMEAVLRALSGSVLVALIVPAAVNGGGVYLMAVITATTIAVWTRRPLPAMTCGVAVAAIVRTLIQTS